MARTDRPSGSSTAYLAPSVTVFNALDWLAIVLLIVGGLNWGLVGALNFDLVAAILGTHSTLSKTVYVAVGLAAVYGFILMAKMARGPR